MAATASKPRPAAAKRKAATASARPGKPASGTGKKLVRRAATKATKALAHRALDAATERLQTGVQAVAEHGGELGRRVLATPGSITRRPPVQASVDVAAPLSVVWEEWMKFESLTEGLHRITEVSRDGGELVGCTAAPSEQEWRAEIVDERREESFAWRSTEGTDCAGLMTFHRLSDRLTRVEADLDVMPTNPAEALLLVTGVPGRRARRELRKFKARVEFISPDMYEQGAND